MSKSKLKDSVKYKLIKDDNGGILQINTLNNNVMVWGQKNSPKMYACNTLKGAIQILKTVNHYNKTGEIKTFKGGKFNELTIKDNKIV